LIKIWKYQKILYLSVMKSIEIAITPEEKTIVSRLSKGEQAEHIGTDLGYPKGTFATKMQQIRLKYGCLNTVHLVAYFLREGIIS
jgi:DNA-binding CsgD family transcriptional regulator